MSISSNGKSTSGSTITVSSEATVSIACTIKDSSTLILPDKENNPTIKDSSTLILPDKENNPLPKIDYSKLEDPQNVVDKNFKLLNKAKLPTLAVRLAKEAYFGPDIMIRCTVRGVGSHHALPQPELTKLKKFLCDLSLPRLIDRRVEFEEIWKLCINSIGQACKQYRIDAAAAASGGGKKATK